MEQFRFVTGDYVLQQIVATLIGAVVGGIPSIIVIIGWLCDLRFRGWKSVVKDGETTLFTEDLSVDEAKSLIGNHGQPLKTGDARRLGQSSLTAFGMTAMPAYDMATVDLRAHTITYDIARDAGFQRRKPAKT